RRFHGPPNRCSLAMADGSRGRTTGRGDADGRRAWVGPTPLRARTCRVQRGSPAAPAVPLMAETKKQLRARARRIGNILAAVYPKARISLDFETPWQCLVATILSAQCTDARVNRVTPVLFGELPDPAAMAAAQPEHVQKLIVTTGFFRPKTKSLMGAAKAMGERYGGKGRYTMENLATLPGVGRKTGNVLLGHVYGKPGFVVGTRVRRVSGRHWVTPSRDPQQIEGQVGDLV